MGAYQGGQRGAGLLPAGRIASDTGGAAVYDVSVWGVGFLNMLRV